MSVFWVNLSAQKVGVVISGGGAKGLYHIGILKALEENNIPIDYISGTSMGAIVAGLYASGYTPWEIEKIAVGPEIPIWVSGKMAPEYMYFYNKMPDRPTMISVELNIQDIIKSLVSKKTETGKEGVQNYYGGADVNSISNLIPSTQLDVGLMQYFSGANAVAKENFDSLYVPFRCVSFDAVTKTQRVWDNGNLSLAVRASMAIPIVFSPVIIDSAVMFDGSINNNFPWKESVEAWNPDFMIGGRCVSGDVLDVSTSMGQAMALMISPTDYNLPDSLGVMIARAVNVGALDFSKAQSIIDMGYADAMEMMPIILERTPYFISKEERDKKRMAFKRKTPVLVFDEVQLQNALRVHINGGDSIAKNIVKQVKKDSVHQAKFEKRQAKVYQKNKSEVIDVEEFKHRYYRIITEGAAKSTFPYANYVDSLGLFDFDVDLSKTPSLGVRAGLSISSATINQGYLGLSYLTSKKNTSFYNIDGYVGAFYNSAQLSHRVNFYNEERDLYLYSTMTFNNYNFEKSNNQRYSYDAAFNKGKDNLNEYYISSLLGMPLGVNYKFETRLALGMNHFSNVLIYNGGDNAQTEMITKSKVRFSSLNSRISSYSLNNLNYPTLGTSQSFSISFTHTGESVDAQISNDSSVKHSYTDSYWGVLKYSRKQYFKLSKSFSLGYLVEGVFGVEPSMSSNAWYDIAPIFQPTLFSKTVFFDEFKSYNYIAFGIMPSWLITDKLELRAEAFGYLGDVFYNTSSMSYVVSAALKYSLPFADLSVSYNRLGISESKKDFFIFSVGVMLFNPRGIIY